MSFRRPRLAADERARYIIGEPPARIFVSFVRLVPFALVIAVALPFASTSAQATGVISGRVTARADTIRVGRAAIAIVGTTRSTTSDANGRFMIDSVPVGARTLRAALDGYRPVERTVTVVPGDTTRVDVVLEPDAQRLAAVHTVARSADAETFATKPDVATITLGAAAIAGVPSAAEPDVIRVAQLLPGVVARNDYNTGLNVRGGEADQNLILLDGYPIYNPFHLGGLSSTFMDATVGGIEIMTGAFPARYGGRLSSVLDVRSAEESRPGLHSSIDLSALGTTGRFAGAFSGGRGTWSIAGRRTYADALASIFTDNIFPYHFHDLHAHASYALGGGTRLTVTAYEGRDVLDANLAEFASDSATKAGSGEWAFNWGNRILGATIAKELGPEARIPLLGLRLGESTTIEQRVSLSGFSTLLDLGDGAFNQQSRINDLTVSGSLLARGESHDRSIGYDLATQRVRYASGSTKTGVNDYDLQQRPASGALWLDDRWRISTKWIVEGGLRGEALRDRRWMALSPRLSLKYFVAPELALTAATARVTQTQHSLTGDGPLRYFEVWLASDSLIPVATAWHWIGGAEKRFGNAGSVRLEGFYKRYDRVLEANKSEDPTVRGDEFLPARGKSYGLDVLARMQPAIGPGGWIAYTYGVSSRWRDAARWAPGHDRRHDLNVVGTWRTARNRFGARFGYATGTPYNPIVGEIARRTYDPSTDRWGTGNPVRRIESLSGARNSARFPPDTRLDLDAAREFKVRGARVAPYISVVNSFNAKNVFVYLYQYSVSPPTRRAISQFPILPSAGVRVEF